MNCTASE